MKTTIANLSNERLEQEIANIYVTASREVPPVYVTEAEGSLISMLWAEFEERLAEGTIPDDTEWTEKEEWETE